MISKDFPGVQQLRIRLAVQGTRVPSLVWEDPTCHGETKPESHSCWVCKPVLPARETTTMRDPAPQLERSHPCSLQLEEAWGQQKGPRAGISSVQFSSVTQLCLTLQPHALQDARLPCPSPTNSQSLLKLMSIESVMTSNHLILCRPLLLPPSIFPSIRVFSSESVLHIRWPKYWCFSFSISLSNEYSGLISFRIDWLHLLAGQGTLKSLFQYHSLKASILWHSAFFMVQLSHLYMTTGKTIGLTRQTIGLPLLAK